jgi:hypothetical protein
MDSRSSRLRSLILDDIDKAEYDSRIDDIAVSIDASELASGSVIVSISGNVYDIWDSVIGEFSVEVEGEEAIALLADGLVAYIR